MLKKIFYHLHHFSLRNLISILSVLIILTGVFVFLNKTPKGASASWYSLTWLFRQSITVANVSGSTLTNEDVLLTVDTSSLITASKLQTSCQDMRFVDSDDSTLLTYWIEAGCNTTTTQVWVRVPSLPSGGKNIYMYYGNNSASDGQASWSGNFTLLYNNTCPSGWTRNSSFDGRFPEGSTVVGNIGGTDYHNHGDWSGNTDTGGNNNANVTTTGPNISPTSHVHSVTISHNATTVLPPYLDMVFCQKNQLDINTGLIAMFDSSTPTAWTRFSALDVKFPRGAATYGGTSGSATHNHTTVATTTANTSSTPVQSGTAINAAARNHPVSSQTIPLADNTPPYLNIIYASADAASVGTTGIISIATSLPPLGWTRFSNLDNNFPMGAVTPGGVGGTETHHHDVVLGTGTGTAQQRNSGGAARCGSHTHTITYTTDDQSNLPPYYTTLFIKKKSSQSTSFNIEESSGDPSNLLTENQTNPIDVNDVTPEFSAIFNDIDVGNSGYYYQIQVNTNSTFTGTIMWDSTKTAMTHIAATIRSQDISYAGTTLTYNNTIYYWRIRFWNQSDIATNWSTTANFTMTNASSSAPLFNCYIVNDKNNASLDIIWSDNTASEINFEIRRSVNSGGWTTLSSTLTPNTVHYLDSTVSNGNTYIYQIAPIFTGPVYGDWCVTPMVSLGSGPLNVGGLHIDGVQIN